MRAGAISKRPRLVKRQILLSIGMNVGGHLLISLQENYLGWIIFEASSFYEQLERADELRRKISTRLEFAAFSKQCLRFFGKNGTRGLVPKAQPKVNWTFTKSKARDKLAPLQQIIRPNKSLINGGASSVIFNLVN